MLGALLGTQNGREVEIVNTFELAIEEGDGENVDHGFLVSRRDQCAWHLYVSVYIVLTWEECRQASVSFSRVYWMV